MRPPDERKILQLAVQRGLLSAAASDKLQKRSEALDRSALELCVEESQLSRSTVDGLAREVSGDPGAMETSVLPDPGSGSSAETLADRGGRAAAHGFPVSGWDRYRFVDYIGGGGMGQVYKAFDPRLQRHVALKFILRDDPRLVQRFKNEALAQARVEHERVCKVHEVGEVDGRPYIAMQYIDGRPLNDVAGELALEQKLVVLREVARGLHAAHRTGLIHRDVKPANILVERGETGGLRPYLVDFGLAKQAETAGMTMTGVIVGTPYYMAPEQASGEGKRVDRRADVYGLGATLYEVLAGRPPFEGGSPTTSLAKVLEEVPDSLHRSDTSIPADVEAIVMKCLRKEPRERYPSARAFLEDLDRFLDGEPIQARPTGWPYRLKLKMVKHRTAVAVGAVALVLLTGALAWGGYTRWTAARRAGLAQAFGQQVERIAALAQQAHTIPLHDIRPVHRDEPGDRELADACAPVTERNVDRQHQRGHQQQFHTGTHETRSS